MFQAWPQGAPQPDLSQVRVQGGDGASGFFWGLFCEILVGEEFVFAVHDDTVAGVPEAPGEPRQHKNRAIHKVVSPFNNPPDILQGGCYEHFEPGGDNKQDFMAPI